MPKPSPPSPPYKTATNGKSTGKPQALQKLNPARIRGRTLYTESFGFAHGGGSAQLEAHVCAAALDLAASRWPLITLTALLFASGLIVVRRRQSTMAAMRSHDQ